VTTETKATAVPDPPAGKAKRDITANGYVNLQGGLSVNAGASGSFFSFFSAATQVSLFNKQFQLFNVRLFDGFLTGTGCLTRRIIIEVLWQQCC
jgi:hypothetical protein